MQHLILQQLGKSQAPPRPYTALTMLLKPLAQVCQRRRALANILKSQYSCNVSHGQVLWRVLLRM